MVVILLLIAVAVAVGFYIRYRLATAEAGPAGRVRTDQRPGIANPLYSTVALHGTHPVTAPMAGLASGAQTYLHTGESVYEEIPVPVLVVGESTAGHDSISNPAYQSVTADGKVDSAC